MDEMVLEESIYDNDIRKILELGREVVSCISLSYWGVLWTPKMIYEPYLKFKVEQEKNKRGVPVQEIKLKGLIQDYSMSMCVSYRKHAIKTCY